ncbi:hypothetical protein HDU97_002779 [Phlyctochytrium planicorne]|nr:hypothetical protein HDU97_002779 [Phlyctochytrium planicorne]
MAGSPRLYLIGLSALAVASFVFFAAAVAIQGVFILAPGYWTMFTFIYSLLSIFALLPWLRQGRPSKYETETSPYQVGFGDFFKSSWGTIIIGVIGTLGSFMAFCGSLAARTPEKPTAAAALFTCLAAAVFLYVKYQTYVTTNGITLARSIYDKSPLLYGAVFLPLLGFLGTLLGFLQLTATIHSVSLGKDWQSLPPYGEMLPVGGPYSHKLHVYCVGEKKKSTDPTIWFEHGLGGQALEFTWVQADAAKYGRACAYDHAGLGYSEVGPFPRTTEGIVDELDNLLRTNNISGDLIMVGHSMGGFNTRVAERKLTANKVVGLVLVDPVSYLDYNNCERGAKGNVSPLYNFGVQINTLGIVRLLSFTSSFPQIKNIRSLPDGKDKNYISNLMLNSNQITRNSEALNFVGSCGQTKEILNAPRLAANGTTIQDPTLGDMPFGLVICYEDDAVSSQTLYNVSTNQVTYNATTSAHVSILHREEEAQNVIKLVRGVFTKVTGTPL